MTLLNIVRSSSGYFFVALACGLAGSALDKGLLEMNRDNYFSAITYAAYLLPIYFYRSAIHEQNNDSSSESIEKRDNLIRLFSVEIPVLTFIIINGALIYLSFIYFSYHPALYLKYLFKMLIAAFPIYLFILKDLLAKYNSKFVFLYVVFFPALAACVSAFIFSWSSVLELGYIIISTALVILVWWLSFYFKKISTITVFLGLILVFAMSIPPIIKVFSLDEYLYINFVYVFNFGILMTLIMGVSESWRITTRLKNDYSFSLYKKKHERLYLSGTNIATAVFFPLFMLTYLQPATNLNYVVGVFFYLIAQYLFWFYFLNKLPYKAFSFWRVFFGFIPPLLIVFGSDIQGASIPRLFPIPIPRIAKFLSVLAFGSSYVTLVGKKIDIEKMIDPNVSSIRKLYEFQKPAFAVYLTGFVAFILLIILFSGPIILDLLNALGYLKAKGYYAPYMERIRFLQAVYLFVFFLCGFYVYTLGGDKQKSEQQSSLSIMDFVKKLLGILEKIVNKKTVHDK